MGKLVVAIALAALVAVIVARTARAASATPSATPEASPTAVLGSTRAEFVSVYGKPTNDAFTEVDKSLHSDDADFYDKKQKVDLHVEFVVNPDNVLRPTDRAFDIAIVVPNAQKWTLDQASSAAAQLLPRDAVATSKLAPALPGQELAYDWQTQTYSSASLAALISDQTWWTTDGAVGDFAISIQSDVAKSYSQISIGTVVQP